MRWLRMVLFVSVVASPAVALADRTITVDGVDEAAWTGTAAWADSAGDAGNGLDFTQINITNDNTSGANGKLYVKITFAAPPPKSATFTFRVDFGTAGFGMVSWTGSGFTFAPNGGQGSPIPGALAGSIAEFSLTYQQIAAFIAGFGFGNDRFTFFASAKSDRAADRAGTTWTYDGTLDPSAAAVSLLYAHARAVPGGNVVAWKTGHEVRNVAFRLLRRDPAGLTEVATLPGRLDATDHSSYEVFDAGSARGAEYVLVDVEVTGAETAHEVGRAAAPGEPAKAALRATPATAARLSRGAVYVDVDREGLVRVDAATLASAGLNAQHARLSSSAGDVVSWSDGADLLFYAPTPRRSYDARDTYLLERGRASPLTPAPATGRGRQAARSQVEVTTHVENDVFYWSGARTDAPFVWAVAIDRFFPARVVLPVAGPVANTSAKLHLELEGATSFAPAPDHDVEILLNGASLGRVQLDGFARASFDAFVPAGVLQANNVLTVQALRVPGVAYDGVYLDFAGVTYTRDASAPGYVAELRAPDALALPSHLLALDVTDPTRPRALQRDAAGLALVSGPGLRRIAVADPAAARAPAAVRPVGPAMPATSGADYVVIHDPALTGAAATLASARAASGLTTLTLSTDSIERTFAAGSRGPGALRALFAAMRAWPRVPKAVVLLGAASYDPRGLLHTGRADLVPTAYVRSALDLRAASDLALASAPGQPLAPFEIGRLPANSAAEADALVAKVLASERQAATAQRAVAVEGSGTDSADFLALAGRVAAAHRLDTRNGVLRPGIEAALSAGVDVLTFVGHGSASGWTYGAQWTSNDAAAARNAHLPVLFSFTCYDGMFDNPNGNALAAAMVLSAGGARAAFSPSTALVPTQHDSVLRALQAAAGATLGERVRHAREALARESQVAEQAGYVYNLLGDPLAPAVAP